MYKLTYDDAEDLVNGDLSLPSPLESPQASVPNDLDDDPLEETIYKKGPKKSTSSAFTFKDESSDNQRKSSVFQNGAGQEQQKNSKKKRVLSLSNVHLNEGFPSKREFIKHSITEKLKCLCSFLVVLIILLLIASVTYLYVLIDRMDKQNNNQVVITSSVIDENRAFANINESNAGYAELTKLDHDQRPPDIITKTEVGEEVMIGIDQQRPPVNTNLKPSVREEQPPVLSTEDQFSLETVSWAKPPIPPQQRNISPPEDTRVVFHGFGLARKTPGIMKSRSTYKLTTSIGSSKTILYNYELINRKNKISQTDKFTVSKDDIYEIEVKFCTWKYNTAAVQLFKNRAVLHEFQANPDLTVDVDMEPGFRFQDPIDTPDLLRKPPAPVKKVVQHSFNMEEKLCQGDVLQLQLFSGTLVEQKSKDNDSCLHFIVKKASSW